MIAGYCWPQSGAAGDAIDLMISATGGSCRVEVLRIGASEQLVFVSWAERNGVALDYATSLDLHSRPDLLAGRRLYISVGHDEYWSEAMRDQVEDWVEAGGAARCSRPVAPIGPMASSTTTWPP